MSIFGLFFLIIIIILAFGLSIVSSILRALFGFGKRKDTTGQTHRQSQTNNSQRQNTGSTVNDPGKKHKKFFDDNEGEYVDFEEIKEGKE